MIPQRATGFAGPLRAFPAFHGVLGDPHGKAAALFEVLIDPPPVALALGMTGAGLLREPFHPPSLRCLALPFSSTALGERLPCSNYATPPFGTEDFFCLSHGLSEDGGLDE